MLSTFLGAGGNKPKRLVAIYRSQLSTGLDASPMP